MELSKEPKVGSFPITMGKNRGIRGSTHIKLMQNKTSCIFSRITELGRQGEGCELRIEREKLQVDCAGTCEVVAPLLMLRMHATGHLQAVARLKTRATPCTRNADGSQQRTSSQEPTVELYASH
jgi:hypothetical protein